jgi:hypothetical protein
MRPQGLKPALILEALRGAEAPLFQVLHAFVGLSGTILRAFVSFSATSWKPPRTHLWADL